jgi:hypothetical protein
MGRLQTNVPRALIVILAKKTSSERVPASPVAQPPVIASGTSKEPMFSKTRVG